MRSRPLLFLVAAVLALAVVSLWPSPAAQPEAGPTAAPTSIAPAPSTAPVTESPASTAAAAGDLIVAGVEVRGTDGRVVWRGDVDLAPVLARIEAGVSDPHRNDGGVFGNRERLLPAQRRGYYREYVIRTPGISHAGPQRLVVGEGGELWYTSDHYASFRRVRP